jgi:hypothetical protein
MKPVKFITTFSEKGYHLYGKNWIETFLQKIKKFPHITANVYINGMNLNGMPNDEKIKVLDFDKEIPEHREWISFYNQYSKHFEPVRTLNLKFSYKSFVMFKALENINEGYIIWLDADCIFLSDKFKNFPESLIGDSLIACQLEKGSEHVESGIVIFNAEHPDKKEFYDTLKDFYLNKEKINSFGELFDGYVLRRTINWLNPDMVDLNEKYGYDGIQSDPTCTFLNPEIGKRFLHNIGITGKRSYENWERIKEEDSYFSLLNKLEGKKQLPLSERLSLINEATKNFVRNR